MMQTVLLCFATRAIFHVTQYTGTGAFIVRVGGASNNDMLAFVAPGSKLINNCTCFCENNKFTTVNKLRHDN